MFPYLIAGAIGFAVAKIFENDKSTKYADGGELLSDEMEKHISYLNELLQNNNELAKSYNYKGTHKALWCVPFYDSVQDKLLYIASNTDYEEPLNITLIVNDNKIIKLNIVKFTWHLIEIDDFG